MAATFTPALMQHPKNADLQEYADTPREYNQLLWDGWRVVGAAPPPPPSLRERIEALETGGAGGGLTAEEIAADPTVRAAFVTPRGTRTIVLGDSIDASVRGWFPFFALGSKRIEVVRNAGVGGETTAQMLARIQADVLDYEPDVVILGGATNDHGSGVGESTTRANIDAMVSRVRSAGATAILRTTPPADNAGQGAYNTVTLRRAQILRHNAWLYGYAAARGIDVLDIHQAVVDPATGGYKAGITSDGIHPTEVGGKAVADYLLSLPLPGAIERGSFPFARAVTDGANMLINGVFTGDTNADGIANNWTPGGSPTGTLTAGTTGVTGNWQRVATADTTSRWILQDAPSTSFSVGDVVQLVGRVRSSGGAAARVRLSATGGGTGLDPVADLTQAIDGVFSARLTVPTGTTALRVQVQAGAATGWVEVAEVALRNLSRLGLV